MAEFLVVRNILNPSLKSTALSPIMTTQRGPWCTRSRLNIGMSTLSMESSSCRSRVFPNRIESSNYVVNFGSYCEMDSSPPGEVRKFALNHSLAYVLGSISNGTLEPLNTDMEFSIDS